MKLAAALAVALVIAGCGDASDGSPPAIDSTVVDVLADLHLADARASLDTTGAGLADSLRQSVLRAHDTDSAALAERLEQMADDPKLVRATYDALDARLSLEQQGIE